MKRNIEEESNIQGVYKIKDQNVSDLLQAPCIYIFSFLTLDKLQFLEALNFLQQTTD